MLDNLIGLISKAEGEKLQALASTVERGVIVEVGSHRGKSTCYLAEGSRLGHGVWVHAIDLWLKGKNPHWNKRAIYNDFLRQIEPWSGLIIPIMKDSQQAAATWREPIGLLFIDANHHYEAAKADYDSWADHVLPGGYLVYDDRFKKAVRKVIAEIKATGEWHEFEEVGKLWMARKR